MNRSYWLAVLSGAGIGCAAVALAPVSGLAAAIDASVDAEICLVMAGLSLTVLAFLLPHADSWDRVAGEAHGDRNRSKSSVSASEANALTGKSNAARDACLDLLLGFLVFLIGGLMIGAVESNGSVTGPDAPAEVYASAISRVYGSWNSGVSIEDILLLADPALTLPTIVMGVILLIAASLKIRAIIPGERDMISS